MVKQRKLQVCTHNFQVPWVLRLRITRIGDLYLLALNVILIYIDIEISTGTKIMSKFFYYL